MMLSIKSKIQTLSQATPLNQPLLLVILYCLMFSKHLILYWRVGVEIAPDFDDWFLQTILYLGILHNLYQRRNSLIFSNRFPANIIGSCLIIFPYLTANFSLKEMSISWLFLPLINAIGLALLASGFRGIKQFQRELNIIVIFPFVLIILRALFSKLIGLIPLPVIYAKISFFIFWYLGFQTSIQGTIVSVNGGAIDVYWGCTGVQNLLLLLKFSLLLVICFPSVIKNAYLPFILAIIISSICSVARLMIMALVVNDKPAFHYWHSMEGGNIFLFLSFVSFGGIILLLSPNKILSLLPTEIISQKSRPASRVGVVTAISLVFLLLNFGFDPKAGLIRFADYRFPPQISLPSWQFVDSKPISLVPQPPKEGNPLEPQTGTAPDKIKAILSEQVLGQVYRYQKAGQNLTVNFYYMPLRLPNDSSYVQQFSSLANLPSSTKLIETVNTRGHHLLFSDEHNRYLTACINSQGKSTITYSQFAAYFYRPYLNPALWFNLFNGKQTLRDRRCLWGQVSLTGKEARDAELETIWQELLSYWENNFPKLKL